MVVDLIIISLDDRSKLKFDNQLVKSIAAMI